MAWLLLCLLLPPTLLLLSLLAIDETDELDSCRCGATSEPTLPVGRFLASTAAQ